MKNRPKYIDQEIVKPPVESGYLPQVKLMQALSPELDKESDKYIKGASIGDIVVTGDNICAIFSGNKGFSFIPVAARKLWVEWVPRAKGGGFVASYTSRESMEQSYTPGNEIQISIDYLVISREFTDDEEFTPAVIQFNTPSKLPTARQLANYISSFKTMSGVKYRIFSGKRKNKNDQTFYTYLVEPIDWLDPKTYKICQKVRKQNENYFLENSSNNEEM